MATKIKGWSKEDSKILNKLPAKTRKVIAAREKNRDSNLKELTGLFKDYERDPVKSLEKYFRDNMTDLELEMEGSAKKEVDRFCKKYKPTKKQRLRMGEIITVIPETNLLQAYALTLLLGIK